MLLNRRSRAGYGVAVDWWSLGTLIFEMLTGAPPFYDSNMQRMCHKILTAPLVFPPAPRVSAAAQDLVRGLLQRDPAHRLCGDQVRAHPFFSGISWEVVEQRRLRPPFRPRVRSETDLRHFDTAFTSEPARLSPEDVAPGAGAALAAGGGDDEGDGGPPQRQALMESATFSNFTFVAPSELQGPEEGDGLLL